MAAPNFMRSPLVMWVQTFISEPLTYQELCDGIFLNEVMQQIDGKTSLEGMNVRVDDKKDRLRNWELLLKNINSFYQDVLQQYLILQPPDINIISHQPESDACHTQLERVLLLVLGCAVQSDQKEQFIENIKQLNIETQHDIANSIQQITDCSCCVFPMNADLEQMDELALNLYNHLCSLLHQRDFYVRTVKELQCILEEADETDEIMTPNEGINQHKGPNGLSVDATTLEGVMELSSDKRCHVGVELAQSKARLRRMRHELEDKCDAIEELQEELESVKQSEQRLRVQNRELLDEARAAKCYRDELDIFAVKASRVEKLELEITRLKEKLNEFEFYRARVEELRADNSALIDTNHQLTEQLEVCHKRIEMVVDLENDLQNYKQQLALLSEERDESHLQIGQLMRENARLEFEGKLMSGENDSSAVPSSSLSCGAASSSLMDQLSETTNSHVLRLELENQRLRHQLNEFSENQTVDSAAKMLVLEKENGRLSQKVEKLLNDVAERERKTVELENTIQEMNRLQKDLEETVNTVQESGERQIHELEKEIEQLTETLSTVRSRNEQTNDCRILDLERDNKKLSETATVSAAQVVRLEWENKQMTKNCEKMTEAVEQIQQLRETNESYENEVEALKRTVQTLQTSCEKLESVEEDSTALQVENARLMKSVELLQQTVSKKEEVEKENINLSVEVQHLKRSVEMLKASSAKTADAEHEKEELRSIIRKGTEDLTAKKAILKKLEVELYDSQAENHRLTENIQSLTRQLETLQQEHLELEERDKDMSSALAGQKQLEKKLQAVQVQKDKLETENRMLGKDKISLEKENKKLKQTSSIKETEADELCTKVFELETINQGLTKSVDRMKDCEGRLHELEKENLDLNQRMSVDRKTLAALRQDLVNEKVRTQQLTDEIEEAKKKKVPTATLR